MASLVDADGIVRIKFTMAKSCLCRLTILTIDQGNSAPS